MKIQGIIYKSNTGFTEKYARLFESETGLPCYPLDAIPHHFLNNSTILYFGWLRAGAVVGLKKAMELFRVQAVCSVGMADYSEELVNNIQKANKLADIPLFYLQGGYDSTKLHGADKLVMKLMHRTITSQLSKKGNLTPAEESMLSLLTSGGDHVSLENLKPVILWLKETNEPLKNKAEDNR